MSVSSTIATIKQRMTEFKIELLEALDKVSGRAPHADVADHLSNLTPAEVIAQLRNEVTLHTNKKGQGIHKVDLESLGTYTKAQFDGKLDQLLDNSSGVPFSFYGDREYLPPGITGSFESGSSVTPYGNVALMLEDNGTLVMLRSGTDGDSCGLYYSYLRNAQNEPDITNGLVTTNTRYAPAYFPLDRMAYCMLNGTQDVIIGRLVNKSNNAFNGYFVSLTNNTFDQTKHTGVVIPEGNIFDTQLEGAATYNSPMAYIKGGYVYFLIRTYYAGDLALKLKVYRMPVANLISGIFVQPERVTGWTINRGNAGVVVRDDITLFDSVHDTTIFTGNPIYIRDGLSAGNGAMTVNVTDAGKVLVTYAPYLQVVGVDRLTPETGFHAVYHFEIPDNKVIDVAKYHNDKMRIYYDSVNIYFYPTAAFPTTEFGTIGGGGYYNTWAGSVGGQSSLALYTTKFNQMWIFSSTSYVTERNLSRFTYTVGADYSAVMSGISKPIGRYAAPFTGRFGTPLSQAFTKHGAIGDYVVTCANNNNRNGVYGRYSVRSVLEGAGNYRYNSISGQFNYLGFNPTANRQYFEDFGKSDYLNILCLNEGDPVQGGYVSQARFSISVEPTRVGFINDALGTAGTVTCPRVILDSLKQQAVNDLSARGYALYANAGLTMSDVEFIVPQLYSDMPPFILVGFIRNDRSSYQVAYSVNISGSRQNVTGASIISGSFAITEVLPGSRDATWMSNTDIIGQSAIRRVAGGFALGMMASSIYAQTGDAETVASALFFNTATGVFSFSGTPVWSYYNVAAYGWLNFPNRGMFFSLSSEYLSFGIDAGTKMIATLACTNQPITLNPNNSAATLKNPNLSIVMISQKIVSAWSIFFSDVTPAMLDGTYQLVQPITHNLIPGTDANKTFYIWLVKRNNVISYQIVDSNPAAPAAEASLYLGYARTTTEGIQQIVAEKRVAVGGMVLARNSQGSGIPLTSGTPNTPGYLNWK